MSSIEGTEDAHKQDTSKEVEGVENIMSPMIPRYEEPLLRVGRKSS